MITVAFKYQDMLFLDEPMFRRGLGFARIKEGGPNLSTVIKSREIDLFNLYTVYI